MGDDDFKATVFELGRTIGSRYRDRFAEYDLNNEMMHADYYEQRFGIDIIRQMAQSVKEGDPNARLFVNDYDMTTGNRLEDYVKHIRKLLDAGVPISGIGVQGHLHGDSFDPAALQRSLDELFQFPLPIRITEFNFPGQRSKYYIGDRRAEMTPEEEQAKAEALKRFFTICFAHPSVTGSMMWVSGRAPTGSRNLHFTNGTGHRCRPQKRTKNWSSIYGGPVGRAPRIHRAAPMCESSTDSTRSR
jgi:GH35 family endo-1,4-beta-xylanase